MEGEMYPLTGTERRFQWTLIFLMILLVTAPHAAWAKRTIFGQIKDTAGNPVPGLVVKAWDDDVDIGAKKDDDYMGHATTDGNGNYRIVYREGKWDPDIKINESWRPDIYIAVFAKSAIGYPVRVAKSKPHKDHKVRNDLKINLAVPKMEVLEKNTGFNNAVHGFPFPNEEKYTESKWGACGGMCLTALRRFRANKPVEQYATDKLRKEIEEAQKETVLPGHWSKFVEWQAKPTKPHATSPHTIGYSTIREWPDLKKKIDIGSPVILGLIRVQSANPKDVPENHQVLATGYSYNTLTKDVKITVYDPNHPKLTSFITMNLGIPPSQIHAKQTTYYADPSTKKTTEKVEAVRGFFLIREGSATIRGT